VAADLALARRARRLSPVRSVDAAVDAGVDARVDREPKAAPTRGVRILTLAGFW
jgi:hypothetical protein